MDPWRVVLPMFTSFLHGLLTTLLDTPRAWPFDQIHGQVSVAQFGDEVGGDHLPGAGFWAPDSIMVLTILHVGNAALLDHFSIQGWDDSGRRVRAIGSGGHPSGCRAAAPE